MRAKLLAVLIGIITLGGMREATAGILYAFDDNTNTLVTIDRNTQAITTVGSTGIGSGDFGDLAYDPINGNLYWAAGRGNNNLYVLNQTTGAATLVGNHGINDLFALGFDSANGKMYGEDSFGKVYTIDLTTAASTLVGSNSVYPGGLDYRADTNQLILLEAGRQAFYQINPVTGAATLLGGTGFNNDNDFTYDSELNVFWSVDYSGFFRKFDPTTYAVTGQFSLGSTYDGIAFVPDQVTAAVPEPATLTLWSLGALGCAIAGYRRRRSLTA